MCMVGWDGVVAKVRAAIKHFFNNIEIEIAYAKYSLRDTC